MSLHNPHIIISGGGTGGHIFPALAIARRLQEEIPGVEILFIGARGKMEMQKVPEAGFPIRGLWISGISRSLSVSNLSFPFKMVSSLANAWRIIHDFKPDAAIGVGGYASGPALKMASWMGVPTLIHESNSFPGITNKWLGGTVDRVCVAYPGMEKYFPKAKIIVTGNPVRREVIEITGKEKEAAGFFGLEEGKLTLLVIGGSQGALSMNRSVAACLDLITTLGIQMIWQTGPVYLGEAREQAAAHPDLPVTVTGFIRRMDLAYALAGIVISRAGAITLAELANVRKPVVFVPLPSAAEDHQYKNAETLVNKKAALVVRDERAAELLPEILSRLAGDQMMREELSRNIGEFAIKDADSRIVAEIIKLIEA